MNIFERYSRYLTNNPKGYWFKRKPYGWGWTPAKWQGWFTLVVFLLVFVWFFIPFMNIAEPTGTDVTWFLIRALAWVITLIGVCYLKGESPKWQWGLPEESQKHP